MLEESYEDPLNIGNFMISAQIKTIPVTGVCLSKVSAASNRPVDLFEIRKVNKKNAQQRKKSLLRLSKEVRSAFNNEITGSEKSNSSYGNSSNSMLNSNNLLGRSIKAKENYDEDFSKFLVKDNTQAGRSNALKQTRLLIVNRSLDVLNSKFTELKNRFNESVQGRANQIKECEQIISKMQAIARKGADKNREIAALHIIYHKKLGKSEMVLGKSIKNNMERIAAFIEYINEMKKEDTFLPAIDADSFIKSLEQCPAKYNQIIEKANKIKPFLKEIKKSKPGTRGWYRNMIHPDSKSGKIIERFEGKIESLTYEDVYSVADHLANLNSPNEPYEKEAFIKIEQLLFDLAWQTKEFPFGYSRKAKLPISYDLFPAAVGKTLIPREYAMTSFSTLSGMKWPFKSAIDKIFDMMILTNPFEIAAVFWDVIQEAAQCMQKVMVIDEGIRSEDVEIDFDSLFPILMICVFLYGCDEWMTIAMYTISFNEQVSDDPQLEFAMTYLEGLVTHILALDPAVLKKKASDLRRQWAEEENDPLGLF